MSNLSFLQKPNLPDGPVKLIAISDKIPEILRSLSERKIALQVIKPFANLPKPVSGHADMLIHDMGNGDLIAAKGQDYLIGSLSAFGFKISTCDIQAGYPDEAALNCFTLRNYLFCNIKSIDRCLLNHYDSRGYKILNISQGYTKCSTCIVDERSIITSDAQIARKSEEQGFDVLQIHSGNILLPGYDTGFIGGCCGLIDENILAFTGKISRHKDYVRIRIFCESKNVAIMELTDLPLIDIGGILPLATS